jgi:hypothetical protein
MHNNGRPNPKNPGLLAGVAQRNQMTRQDRNHGSTECSVHLANYLGFPIVPVSLFLMLIRNLPM